MLNLKRRRVINIHSDSHFNSNNYHSKNHNFDGNGNNNNNNGCYKNGNLNDILEKICSLHKDCNGTTSEVRSNLIL